MPPTPAERLIRGFLDHLAVERGASVNTVGAYRRDLNHYLEFLNERGIDDLRAVTPGEVSGFLVWLQTEAGQRKAVSVSSATRALAAVRSLHAFVTGEGVTLLSPAAEVHPPKGRRRLPKALSLTQLQALLATPDPSTPTGLRDAALLELLYGTGARISEVLAIDVDEATSLLAHPDGGLRIFGKGRKERIVPVGSFARKAVEDWLVRGRPVFAQAATRPSPALLLNSLGRRLSRQSAWQLLHAAGVAAELPGEISPHTLRHTFATHLLDGGADVRVVQELLGHASVTTTQIYTLVTAEHLREVFLAAHPRAR
ncbi:site-specific tyrosine recombinase XerD [Propionicimonas sp.]|uniref:site-specific tyrosine recombinase XerD n=1 Tax=Propionicimonas sp. TaxID=1955623 RepID=UPI00185D6D5B|nr:site-specific tyrosine recombinase XerD [Propionicimonas sp.]MBU3977172.1 site-specific tyrosine recombinase XerD [Actinomycetota bacterium]MBA3021098.1 site-specific tyrosine recombinase XerD [Propionicimonas sp.]MBU3985682.1 site-specific tyrosine recombinase XerD [Actinomycetota bacterium]MBU4008467.1 site-specific tyrosine recombinase XerD [Actinomycetota bacterium]MBU4066383.1 site-specific tyrosine recombinase XerD [Actinomycetota bacterium]